MSEGGDEAKDKDIDQIMKNIQDSAVVFDRHDSPIKYFKHKVIRLKFHLMTIYAMKNLQINYHMNLDIVVLCLLKMILLLIP